jgi:hypothetical protein
MYNNEAVETLTAAVLDIILPNFKKYIETKQKDSIIEKEVADTVEEIEQYEDLIDNIFENKLPDISDNVFNHGIDIGGWYFRFNKETGSFGFQGDILDSAKEQVYRNHKLYIGWRAKDEISRRISAIITTMSDDATFDNIVAKIEKEINFDEYILNQ